MSEKAFSEYIKAINSYMAVGVATESSYRDALQRLFEGVAPKKLRIIVINEPKRGEYGAPDLAVYRGVKRIRMTTGYVETKNIGVSLDEAEKSEQLTRYRKALENLILTDYLEFRHYVQGDLRSTATLPRIGLGGRIGFKGDDRSEVAALLNDFLVRTPEPIKSPRELAERMARLTHMIRDVVIETLKAGESHMLDDLRQAMATSLIKGLDDPSEIPQFADIFAQTLAYGLFAARVNYPYIGTFTRQGADRQIPKTNPFLRKLFGKITGEALDDEPYVGFVDDLAYLLAHTEMAVILKDFGAGARRRDPVVHFYETFLAAYDPNLRELRGVYYTPEPVVSYIVRSVDHILKNRFDCPDGLADTSKVEYEKTERVGNDDVKSTASVPKVLILDPACGTGTFLYFVIDHIRELFKERGDAGLWQGYVAEELLPRIFGFELLMAPYAVAHFKLALQLEGMGIPEVFRGDWVYNLEAGERLNVFMTNSLEDPQGRVEALLGFREITEEADEASRVKKELPILVVIGNPPYSADSANKGKWISRLVREEYYPNDDMKEQNPKLLLDDYVKFIRFAQWRIEKTGAGVLAFITNHAWLDNPTFRRMREKLLNTFDEIYILDLHGNSKKKEKAPDGSKDENVFDIQQGVAISIFVKKPKGKGKAIVRHADLWGRRMTQAGKGKYPWLLTHDIKNTKWRKLKPAPPFYLFIPFETKHLLEYEAGWRITDVFNVYSTGVKTHRDHFVLDFDKPQLEERMSAFRNPAVSDEEIRDRHQLRDTRDWELAVSRKALAKTENWKQFFQHFLYRPFDSRHAFFHKEVIELPREEVMRHMLAGTNIGLITTRQTCEEWAALATCLICGHKSCAAHDINTLFPLYLFIEFNGELEKTPNLDAEFIAKLEAGLKLEFLPAGTDNLKKAFGPEDVFNYIYAVFHSPTYRRRYAEFLKIDFPRIPLPSDRRLFGKLCSLGRELVSYHLLEAGELKSMSGLSATNPVKGTDIVDKGFPKYYPPGKPSPDTETGADEGRVYINKGDPLQGQPGQCFYGVPPEVWEFHVGGYQVCHKWLKDRRGRVLSYDDQMHYIKIVAVLSKTIELMSKIEALDSLTFP